MKSFKQYLAEAAPLPAAKTAPDSKAVVDATIAASDDLSPEQKAEAAAMIKYEADGTIDIKGSLVPMMQTFADALPALMEFCNDMAAAIEHAQTTPEWATFTPQQQQEALATAAECRKSAAQIKAQIPQLQQQITQAQAMPTTAPAVPAPVQEDAELTRWLKIAGLAK